MLEDENIEVLDIPSHDAVDISVYKENPVEIVEESFFNENLAEILSEGVLQRIAGDLIEDIDDDFESRKEWEQGLANAVKQLGLRVDETDFPFQNACGIYSPVMMQAITEFYSQAVAELLPLEGPVKEIIIGDPTEELEEQAKRVSVYANYFFTQEAEEFYPDFKKMIPWVALMGMAVRKVYYDPILQRPTSRFIKAQDFVVDYDTTSLANCWRMTEVLHTNAAELEKYYDMGIYRRVDIAPYDGENSSTLEEEIDQSEGLSKPAYDKSVEYRLYECSTFLDERLLEDDLDYNGEDASERPTTYRPYRVIIHPASSKILAIYRNWRMDDDTYQAKKSYVDYGFMDGLGFYKLGAAHLIGGLAHGSTTLLRQYVDGNTLSNFPGGMYAKGMRLEDNNIRMGPTEFVPVDTMGNRIQDSIMLMPYKDPSPAINELRKELEMSAAQIMGAANQQMGEFNPTAPVGTTYALLDTINLVQSTVIRGLRDSMSQEIKLFYELFAEVLPAEQIHFDAIGGATFICADDFSSNIRLVPIADPYVTTKMQRLMRAQMIVQMADNAPDLYDRREANLNLLREIKLPDSLVKKLLPDPDDAPELDPVTENQRLMRGEPVKAYIDQDHAAHRIVVQSLMAQPNLPPNVAAAAAAHDAEHQAFEFLINIYMQMGIPIPKDPEDIPPEVQNQIAIMAAQVLQNQQQMNAEGAPPPPLDPSLVLLEEVKVKAQEVEQRAVSDRMKYETEMLKLELQKTDQERQYQEDMIKYQIEREKMDTDRLSKEQDMELRLIELTKKLELAEAELAEKRRQTDLQIKTKAYEIERKLGDK